MSADVETTRLEAFSDGVFAVAITLLVFDIKVPPPGATLGAELYALWPVYMAYSVSALVFGAIWINHHKMFQHIVRADGVLMLLNILYLMLVAFLPFPTAVFAGALHSGQSLRVAAAFYGGTLTVLGIFVNVMWWYAAHRRRLIGDHLTNDAARRIGRRFLAGPLGYAVATAISLVVPWVALQIYLGLNLFYLWPRHGHAHSSARGDDK